MAARVLNQAHRQLTEIRRTHPNAAGLVIAIDQDHARGIGKIIEQRFGVRATVATSDDPMASARIAHFTGGADPWIVAVRMVSEGVDIPRLRVGVFATNTTTDLFFRQAIGRLVRHIRGLGRQPAYMFIPDDARLRTKAAEIAQHRRHSLRKREDEEENQTASEDFDEVSQRVEENAPSLFAPISAVALGEVEALEEIPEPDVIDLDSTDDELTIELAPAPVLEGSDIGDTITRAQHKSDIREANAEIVRELVNLTGMSHRAVNGELNKLTGIKRITEATVRELEARQKHAERWISRLIGRD